MPPVLLRVLTWNINFRSAATLDPIAGLRELPDIVTLQEVAHARASTIEGRLRALGYEQVIYSGDLSVTEKRYGNVIAANRRDGPSLEEVRPGDAVFPYPHLVAHARVGDINLITAHVPNGSGNGWKKISTLRALRQCVKSLRGQAVILTGDFNEPQYAMQDDRVVTWGPDQKWRTWDSWTFHGETGTGEDWDAAVRWFFESSPESGLRNAYWESAGHGTMEASHFSRGSPRWFDHVFVSSDFTVESCKFLHGFRESGSSDHSALLAVRARASG
jgi:endonuclease/exonuclease/phosphatase family metal-dependent hydrolase